MMARRWTAAAAGLTESFFFEVFINRFDLPHQLFDVLEEELSLLEKLALESSRQDGRHGQSSPMRCQDVVGSIADGERSRRAGPKLVERRFENLRGRLRELCISRRRRRFHQIL